MSSSSLSRNSSVSLTDFIYPSDLPFYDCPPYLRTDFPGRSDATLRSRLLPGSQARLPRVAKARSRIPWATPDLPDQKMHCKWLISCRSGRFPRGAQSLELPRRYCEKADLGSPPKLLFKLRELGLRLAYISPRSTFQCHIRLLIDSARGERRKTRAGL
jgi:hypothetical protein